MMTATVLAVVLAVADPVPGNRVAGVAIARYKYDALGRRVLKRVLNPDGTTLFVTRFYYDRDRVVEERQGAQNLPTRQYIWGNYVDELLISDQVDALGNLVPANRLYAIQNSTYSVHALVNDAGAVVERYSYTPYGDVTILNAAGQVLPSSAVGNTYLFTGRELDTETGLLHFRARTYSPKLGRFIQRDSAFRDGMNLYEYVQSRANESMDPLGTERRTLIYYSRKFYEQETGFPISAIEALARSGAKFTDDYADVGEAVVKITGLPEPPSNYVQVDGALLRERLRSGRIRLVPNLDAGFPVDDLRVILKKRTEEPVRWGYPLYVIDGAGQLRLIGFEYYDTPDELIAAYKSASAMQRFGPWFLVTFPQALALVRLPLLPEPPALVRFGRQGAIVRVSSQGRLLGDYSRLTDAEWRYVGHALRRGSTVEVVPRAAGRTPDFRIDGVLKELKTLSDVKNATSEGISAALASRIMDGRGQSAHIVVDARQQSGITKEIAERGISRAYGADNKVGADSGLGPKIQTIEVLGPGFELVVPRQ